MSFANIQLGASLPLTTAPVIDSEQNQLVRENLLRYEGAVPIPNGGPAASLMKASDLKVGNSQLEEILNAILPPNCYQKDGQWYQKSVSKDKASRNDVIVLEQQLNEVLKRRQARLRGICPVREDIYRQCFDEIIRQVTTYCPERGLLLLRIRDEVRMTIDAYRTLFDSSVIFGIRKQMQSEDGIEEMTNKISELQDKKGRLSLEAQELRNKLDITEKRINEERQLEQKNYQIEIDFLKHQISHFEQFLKTLETDK